MHKVYFPSDPTFGLNYFLYFVCLLFLPLPSLYVLVLSIHKSSAASKLHPHATGVGLHRVLLQECILVLLLPLLL